MNLNSPTISEKIGNVTVLVSQHKLTAKAGHDQLKRSAGALISTPNQNRKILINLGEIAEIDDFCAVSIMTLARICLTCGVQLKVCAPEKIRLWLGQFLDLAPLPDFAIYPSQDSALASFR